ncbi:MFS transporter [Streptomyces asoensis]|uniref:MFS transporter n=1 Tax=Streptomyces asoensis TaxID=249586 RepID=A0A6M4WSC8_9ACTN|nr:hypothetical protein [Streptomyces asoensis]QJS99202.1 MFS transporter [Streptomyces asoensis]
MSTSASPTSLVAGAAGPLPRSRPGARPAPAAAVVVGFARNVGFYGMIFLLGLYLHQVHGLSALATGVAFLPMTVLTCFMGPVAGRQLGGALAVAVFGALVADRAGLVSGLHTSLLIAAATVAASVVATVPLRTRVPHQIPATTADAGLRLLER